MKFRIHTTLSTPNSSNRCSVIIRVSCQGRVELYTGITIMPSQWNKNKERVKQGCIVDGYLYNVLNARIDEMEKFVEDYFNNSALRSSVASVTNLKERFNHKYKSTSANLSDEFFYLFSRFIEETSTLKGWGKDMKEVFQRLEDKVRAFKADMKFSDLSISTMDAFKVYLSKTMYNDALIKQLSYFKQFINWAHKRNYPIHEEYFTYEPTLPKSKKAVRYLTLEELDTIWNLKFGDRDGLERARDIFMFQCYTALRTSDVSQLKHEHITQNEEGNYYIEILTEKDDDRVKYKLAQRAVKIYLKYKDNVYENGLVLPIITLQKYNEHLKEIGKIANLQGEWVDYQYRLNEKIVIKTPKHELASHSARRTFIVTAMNEGVTLDMIAMITSHSDVNAMKPYIKANTRGTDKVIDAMDNVTANRKPL